MKPYLGTSYYQAIKSPLPDIKKFIRKIANAGGNATEFFILFTWQYKHFGAEMPYVQRGFFEDNKYPGVKFKMWDLDQFNKVRWVKWTKVFKYCRELGITPFIRIEDYCSFKTPYNKRLYFNYASYQRNVLRDEKGKKWFERETWRQRSRLNKRVIHSLRKAECEDFYIIPMNEANMLKIDSDKWCVDYHSWHYGNLQSHGVDPDKHMICSTMGGFDELKNRGLKMEVHGINSMIALQREFNSLGGDKMFWNGDGQDKFAQGRMGTSPKKREPSPAQGRAMGRFIKKHNLFGYCYFNRNTENPLPADIGRAKMNVLKAMVDGYNAGS